jgi:glycosyltransferase involved in cell wall biosynthesis
MRRGSGAVGRYGSLEVTPFVSVLVRSYNRVGALCHLLERLLRQSWRWYEIVVVEQSTKVSELDAHRLDELARDPRIRMLRRPPLGGAAARNVGVEHCTGDIIVFIDDDDLPLHDNFVARHVAAYDDPNCLGISGRQVFADDPDHRYRPLREAVCRTLSYDPILKLPFTYVQHERRRVPVQAIHGTNASIRRSVWQRFGGWDTDTTIEDEVSFCMRVLRGKRPEEYFAYDPRPVLLRNRDIAGGLDKRRMAPTAYFGQYMDFVHRILGRYHPVRVTLLYPCYLLAAYLMSVGWLFENSRRAASISGRVFTAVLLLVTMPYYVVRSLARLPRGTGPALPASATVSDRCPGRVASSLSR